MQPPEDNPRNPDSGSSLAAISAMLELRKRAIELKNPDNKNSVTTANLVTDTQLHTVIDFAGQLRAGVIYRKHPGKKIPGGRKLLEEGAYPFWITSFDIDDTEKSESRLMVLSYDDFKSPAITLTFHNTPERDHEFELLINFGDHPEIDMDNPLTYPAGKKWKEMDSFEYEVISDLLIRALKVFPRRSI